MTTARHWRVAELLDVGGGSALVHFVDWPSTWDQRVKTDSGRLQPLCSFSRCYTGPPSLANKPLTKYNFQKRVSEQQAQQAAKVTACSRPHSTPS